VHDERDGPNPGATRRRFLQAAGLAAAGASALAVRPAWAANRRPSAGGAADGCGCDLDSALPLYAVALHQGAYLGLASTGRGLGLFSLDVDAGQRVSLGAALDLALPAGFIFGSLGVGGGRLVLTGGLPFVWDSYEVDDEIDGAVKDAMEDFPPHVPTAGRRRIDVPGVRPVAYALDLPYARPLALPELPRRVFGVATAVAQTGAGALALLVEHSGELTESWYASAVDLLTEQRGRWSVRAAGRDLGESGPNHLAADGADLVAALRTADGTSFVWPGRERTPRVAVPPGAGRVLGVVSGASGAGLLTAERGGARWWSLSGGALQSRAPLSLEADEIVGALAGSGATGQSVLLGRKSAMIVEEAAVLAGRHAGGEHHVV
jgi:hypothetical protein